MSANRDSEAILVDDIASFYDDPLGFVLYAFDWAEGEGPDAWQRETLESIGQAIRDGASVREAAASGHGIGKSALVAWIILWAMSTRPHLAAVVTANTEAQLKHKTWRELAVWHKRAINQHWFTWTATKFYQNDNPETWFVSAIPWSEHNPEAFAGLHGEEVLVIFDEASAIPDVIWETAEGAMTTTGSMWLVFGNPTRNTGRFRECFGKFRHRWTTRKVDSRTCRMVNKAQTEEWLADYGEDSDFFKVRVRGEFPNAGICQLIAADWVHTAMGRTFPRHAVQRAAKVLGIDVALEGADRGGIVFRQGLYAKVVRVTQSIRTGPLVTLIGQLIREHDVDAAFVDSTGLGAPIVHNLQDLGFGHIVRGVNFGESALDKERFVRRREEMWWLMREWLESSNPSIEHSSDLIDDLIGPEYQMTPAGKIQLESKKAMRARGLASPDLADALALTFAAPVVPRSHFAAMAGNAFGQDDQNYDPLY